MANKKEFIEKLNLLSTSWGELCKIWSELDEKDTEDTENGYPFKDSFESMFYDLIAWKDDLEQAVKASLKKRMYRVGVYETWEQMHEVEATSFEEACELIVEEKSKILEDQFEFVNFDDDPFRFYDV